MRQDGDEIHMDVDDARGASTPNVTRWVLSISLLAVIILLSAIWIIGAWSSDQHTQTVDAQVRAEQKAGGSGNTDSIVGDQAKPTNATTPAANDDPLNVPNNDASGQ